MKIYVFNFILIIMDNSIIFYSNKCIYCKKIIDLISKENIFDNFKLICIDGNSKNYPYIQRVPTLLLSEKQKPLVGVHAFNYLQAHTQFYKSTNNINLNPNINMSSNLNPLLYENDNKLKNNSHNNNFSFVDEKNDTSLIEQFKPNIEKFHNLPEVDRINSTNQRNKLNDLMKLRNRQNFSQNLEISSSSDANELTNLNSSKNVDLNSRYNEINFSVIEGKKVNVTPNVDFLGKLTSKVKIDKS